MTEAEASSTSRGEVSEVWPQEGYGRVSAEGQAFLFDRSDVLDDGFARLVVGTEVEFRKEFAPDMPRARAVRIVAL